MHTEHASKPKADSSASRLPYPIYDLETAIQVGEAVKAGGGANKPVPSSLLAQQLKLEEKKPGFSQRVGAARLFGVIDGRGAYSLTDLGREYFFPKGDAASTRRAAMANFLRSPEVFRSLISTFDGNKLPDSEQLGNNLFHDGFVPESWKDRVANIFLRSARSAGVIDPEGALRVKAAIASKGDHNLADDEDDEREDDDRLDADKGKPKTKHREGSHGDEDSQRAYGWRVGDRSFEIRSPMTLTDSEYAEIEAFVLHVLKLRVKGDKS